MSRLTMILGVAALIVAVSCSKDTPETPSRVGRFTATAEQAAVKTVLVPGNTVNWCEGDMINVFADGVSYQYIAESSGETVSFTGEALSAQEYYALYPYNSAAKVNGSVISTVLPSEQAAVQDGFAGDLAVLVGYTTDDKIFFRQVCGFIKVTVKDEGITSVTVRSNNGCALSGKISIDYNGGSPSVEVQNPVDYVKLVAGTDSTIKPGTYYLVTLPCNLTGGMSVRFNKGSASTACAKATKDVSISRAGILNIGSPEDGAVWKNRTDLSRDGSANCYVVTAAGDYCFIDRKGNSDIATSCRFAEWLWADREGLLYDVTKENDGYIVFSATSAKGNSVVAGCNRNNTILWSWHIWLTDDPTVNACYGLDTSIEIMDRNLGATSTDVDNVESYGLYYQFGRKDPMPGASDIGSLTSGYRESTFCGTASRFVYNSRFNDGVNFLNGASSYFRVKANNSTELVRGEEISHLVNRPMTNICYGGGSYSWFYLPDASPTMVSDVWKAEAYNLWGTDKSTKTQYDPCPAGWRVLVLDKALTSDYSEFASISDKTNGVRYTSPLNTTTDFPAAGFRASAKSGRLADTGVTGNYWTSTPRVKNGDLAFYLLTGSTSVLKNGQPCLSLSVRCVKYNE